MELRAGYKQTAVGVIPKSWDVANLGDLGSVVRGGSPRPAGDPRFFNGSFIPWLTVAALTNISENEMHVSETVGFLTEEGAKHSRTLEQGTLIIANSGATLGVVKILGVKCCANDGIAAIVNHRNGDKEFVCHYVNTRTKYLREVVATGNGQPNLNTTLIKNIAIPFPAVAEQRAIATALSDVDALLAKIDQLISKKRDLKQATMQQLLTGQTRLPGYSGEWEVRLLGEIAHVKTGTKNNDDKVEGGEYPLFVRSQTVERINSYSYDCEAILVPGEGGIGSIFHYINGKFDCHQRVYKISTFSADSCGKFVFFCMKHLFHKQATRNSVKATVDSLRLPTFLSFEFLTPALKEQTAIVKTLNDMDTELAALEARATKTRALKQGMMQELLTGRIRLV